MRACDDKRKPLLANYITRMDVSGKDNVCIERIPLSIIMIMYSLYLIRNDCDIGDSDLDFII